MPARRIGQVLDQLAREEPVEARRRGRAADGRPPPPSARPGTPPCARARRSKSTSAATIPKGQSGRISVKRLRPQPASSTRAPRGKCAEEQPLELAQHGRVQLEAGTARRACTRARRGRGGSRSAAPRGRPPSGHEPVLQHAGRRGAGRAGCRRWDRRRSRGSTRSRWRPRGPPASPSTASPGPMRVRSMPIVVSASPSGSGEDPVADVRLGMLLAQMGVEVHREDVARAVAHAAAEADLGAAAGEVDDRGEWSDARHDRARVARGP